MQAVVKKMLPQRSVATLFFVSIITLAASAWAQSEAFTGPPAVDVLGAHGDAGRGCMGCHVPHNDRMNSPTDAVDLLWGETSTPDYGAQFAFGEAARTVEVAPLNFVSADSEVSGVLLCVSCHDGNITAQNMMAAQSYEQKIGMLPYVRHQVPILLGDPQRDRYAVDHPLGVDAKIETGNGLEFANGKFSVKPDSPYAHFIASYGWPTLAPAQRSNPYGVDADGRPYLVCTTCHNQHAMSMFVSQTGNTIAGGEAGQAYSTFFFVNGPYNPVIATAPNRNSAANMQFCRQCHFDLANEGNGTLGIPTVFH
jgi:hypothetical protein